MRVSLKEKKKQYRAIYEAVFNTPRISINDVASILHVDRNTASNRMEEAFNLEFIGGPHIRKRSFSNLKEYVYFAKFDDPEESYLHYREDENVVFLAMMDGFADLWITSTKELKIKGVTIIGGPRSDYYGAFAPDHTWETAKRLMKEKVDKFDPADYEPMNLIGTHWNEVAEWDAEFEILYRELKYNLRKKQTPIRKKYLISGSKIQKWFERLPECCSITTSYFPEGYRNYDPYFLMVETDYENFVIDLFSKLPTSSFFFKISDKLFIYIFANKYFLLGNANDPASELSKLFLRILVKNLLKKGIIRSESHARLECYCQMNF